MDEEKKKRRKDKNGDGDEHDTMTDMIEFETAKYV